MLTPNHPYLRIRLPLGSKVKRPLHHTLARDQRLTTVALHLLQLTKKLVVLAKFKFTRMRRAINT
ncbi:hypothetical protein CPB84DRAFT_1769985 [Gymnopilus junonius]|uniref:Uncharacterized protein n=1 Tax=Gymnopilus junonius TaxID=109634 RepID=A0A9P5TRD1_GYMJU|nr:hypothetical protein CPB84DRAFT_1769985 [Gymnopilus junonius]